MTKDRALILQKGAGFLKNLLCKIVQKNLSKPFWKFYINKSIQLIENGGWHFNSLLTAEEISIKLKTFAHSEFALEEYSDINIIKKNILNKILQNFIS